MPPYLVTPQRLIYFRRRVRSRSSVSQSCPFAGDEDDLSGPFSLVYLLFPPPRGMINRCQECFGVLIQSLTLKRRIPVSTPINNQSTSPHVLFVIDRDNMRRETNKSQG